MRFTSAADSRPLAVQQQAHHGSAYKVLIRNHPYDGGHNDRQYELYFYWDRKRKHGEGDHCHDREMYQVYPVCGV